MPRLSPLCLRFGRYLRPFVHDTTYMWTTTPHIFTSRTYPCYFPNIKRSVIERSVVERSVIERSVVKRSVVKQSVIEQLVVKRSAVERSFVERPILSQKITWITDTVFITSFETYLTTFEEISSVTSKESEISFSIWISVIMDQRYRVKLIV